MANILIVEDDSSLSTAYQTILEAQGHTVEPAFNGQEALDKLRKFKPQLILLDLLMPVMNGLEFLQNFKQPEGHKTEILLFTNMTASPEVEQARQLGVKSVFVKSMTSPHTLINLIDEALAK